MDRKKTIELIKLSTIGCISGDDASTLNSLMQDDENFPWKELGEFQNLVALLPSALIIETPSWELKDKVARKLYDLRDVAKPHTEEKAIKEPVEIAEDIAAEPIVEDREEEVFSKEKTVNFKNHDLSGAHFQNQPETEILVDEKISRDEVIAKPQIDKAIVEKTVKDYVNSYFKSEIDSTQKSVKKSLIISIALFIIVLLLIGFMYLKFSVDVDSNHQELDKIKKRIGVSTLESDLKNFSSSA